jgi:hypothetical protein
MRDGDSSGGGNLSGDTYRSGRGALISAEHKEMVNWTEGIAACAVKVEVWRSGRGWFGTSTPCLGHDRFGHRVF